MIIGVKAVIKNLLRDGELPDQTNDEIGEEMTLESLDLTAMTSLYAEQGTVAPVEDEKLMVVKHVLDSAIVLWIAIRPVLYDKYANENQQVIQIMANILQALDPYSNTVLADSALTIATYLPKEKVGRMYGKLLKIVEKGGIDDLYFAHYVEALANWDMNMLLEIVTNGLKKLRNFVARTSGVQIMCTPMRTPALASPARKRSRMIDSDPNELSRPLKLIKTLLASPTTAAHLKQQFGVHLKTFHKALLDIRTAFGELLKSDDWKNVDLKIMLSAYETLTVISLIMTPDELEIEIESDDEDAEHIDDAKTALLFIEVRWFESIMHERFPPNQVVQVFLRSSNLHLECGKLSICVLSRLSRTLIKLAINAEENPGLESLQEPIKKAVKRLCTALEVSYNYIFCFYTNLFQFCEEEQEANALIEDKLKPLLTDRNEQDDSDDGL
ncbi:hypothetical protein Ddc_09407 [Ditylenchus destructor]|nr:hypothetical protein Ddc_09407 [Ditylenchus destructor]